MPEHGPLWLPALAPAKLTAPGRAGAQTWETTDGRTLLGLREGGTKWLWSPRFATFRFLETGPVEVDYGDAESESVAQFWGRSVLPLVVAARGTPVLHASAVKSGEGTATVLCGRSTAGKSTLCLMLAQDGLIPLADDAVGFKTDDGTPRVLTLPFKLRPRVDVGKPMGLFRGDGGQQVELTRIVLLNPFDSDSGVVEMTPIAPARAFAELMPHAYCFSLDDREALVHDYLRLVETVPTFQLVYPKTPDALPEMIAAVEELVGT